MPLPEDAPDLRSLDLLLSVAELGSLGKAARRHGISQPAVSLRMNELERRLGITILERTASGTTLTGPGSSVVDWSRSVIEAADAFVTGTAALRAETGVRLRVAASLTVADHLVPGWLVSLRQQAPDASINLSVMNSAAVADQVEAGLADLGFVEGPAQRRPRIRSRTVGQDRLAIVVAPGHPWTRRTTPLPVEALARTSLVLREKGSGTRQVLEEALARHGYRVSANLELGSTSAIIGAARRGEGPAVVSSLAVFDDLAGGRLVEVAVEGVSLDRTFRAIWLSGHRPATLARRLIAIAAG
ncbi:MAG: LysR family transcriptional regulator [Actinomycetota bacterium]|jgi:DNA-binding transcriptional LysR family regulator|nr:LysR family transcriptional regulator [Actinomycetota bacterium]